MANKISGLTLATGIARETNVLWLEQGGVPKKATPNDLNIVYGTTAELVDISGVFNTMNQKVAGFYVWNSTTGAPVWAIGPADGDVWVDGTGATAHTPV